METNNDVLKFTSEVKGFLETASQNGKIPPEKIQSIIGMLENAKQTALAQGKSIEPIQGLIKELKDN